jgi:hypothetical protein
MATVDCEKRLTVAKYIFDQMIDTTKHEDEKCARILSSIAFMTLANTTLFAVLQSNRKVFLVKGLDLIPVVFLTYVILVAIGTFQMLDALGPRFKTPEPWKSGTPASLFFFMKVAAEPTQQWLEYIRGQPEELMRKATDDLMFESHLVAEKIREKVLLIDRAKKTFIAATFLLIVLATLAILSYAI